jgi:alginate O-acetyltransferase complex protein AlgI
MVFSSPTFLFYFFPLFFLFYFLSGRSNLAIFLMSLLFYAWGGINHVALLLFYILVNYLFGLAVERWGQSDQWDGRWVLGLGIAVNLGLLVVFKYLGFLENQADAVLGWLGAGSLPPAGLVLPLGISFFTFQGISYLIDISRGEVRAQTSLLKYATYKSMFPQLIAGPIVRYRQIAGKIDGRRVSLFRLRHGVMLFTLGLAQKCLVANTVAYPADALFKLPPGQLTAATAWLAALCYMAQIFFDFAGYSNMAIGMGHMMGFTFPLNFNRPYCAQSVTEFWRRWHMSLSSWFRDYLYLPLGGNRRGPWRTFANLFTVFLLCGLWHGANWTFAVWGLYHGCFLIVERLGLSQVLARLWRPLRHAYLLLAVCAGWVIFRSDSLSHAAHLFAAMAGWGDGAPTLAPLARFLTPSVATALGVAAAACALPPLSERRVQRALRRLLAPLPGLHAAADGTVVLAFAAVSLTLGVAAALSLATNTYNPFIYFRF